MEKHLSIPLRHAFLCLAFLLVVFPASAQFLFTKADYASGNYPEHIVTADFNGDGWPDLAVTNSHWEGDAIKGVAILLNNGSGGYGAPAIYETGESADDVDTGDLDGDGYPDVVVVSRISSTLTVLLNDTHGAFESATEYAVAGSPFSVRIADFNNDGHPDVVTTSGNNIVVMINNGDGTLAEGAIYITDEAMTLAVGDVDNDGYTDIAVANGASNNVSLLINSGDGTFAPQVTYPTGWYAAYVIMEDLNSDGWSDLAVTNRNDNTLSIFLNNGDGTFAGQTAYPVGSYPTKPAACDLDSDGDIDLLIVNGNDRDISILLNNGDGTFLTMSAPFLPVSSPLSAIIADLDNDDRNDIAVTNVGHNNVSVLLNQSPCPPGAPPGPPTVETTVSKDLALGMNHFYNGCTLLAILEPEEETVGGSTIVTVSFAGDLPVHGNARYLRQYYDINVENPGGATVTLFFSQAEFDHYNTNFGEENEAKLPDNLRIARYSGEYSLTGTSLSAEEEPVYITPSAMTWNNTLACWEVSFDTQGFSGFFITGQSDEALPVTLADFTAAVQEQSALLTWKTGTEVNFSHFEVQRSADSRQWLTLDSIAAAGKSDAPAAYRYYDNSPKPFYNYYRLKMTDLDGTYIYSEIRSVMIGSDGNTALRIYPNPVSDRIYLAAPGTVSGVLLRDISGRTLRKIHSYEKDKGISISGLSAGMILVEVRYADGTIRVGRVIVGR